MKNAFLNKATLKTEYEADLKERELLTKDLELLIEEAVSNLPSNLTIKGRVKSFESFFKKLIRYLKEERTDKGKVVIPDEIGIRIICPFIEDTNAAEQLMKDLFEITEIEKKGSGYSFKEFGYESIHLLFKIPKEIGSKYKKHSGGDFSGEIAEIQIRTILQDAWAEVEHELVYKAEFRPFDAPLKRKLAAINASLSLADTIFQEIRQYQRQLNGQLGKRMSSFFQKIEETADTFIFNSSSSKKTPVLQERTISNCTSIDDLLLHALYSHNREDFDGAINYYTGILTLNPDKKTAALIYKHRGMAFFAQSEYQKAISDFDESIKIDESSYKSAYYSGIVKLVLQQYEKAAEDLTKSLAINQYQPFCFYRRAEAYYHLQDHPAALADCESALALDSNLEGAEKLKQMLLAKLKM
ncbi:MAG: tetratricopeptide repeat protein [Spirochaetaceae bacterium]|nr:tetratricopeptide repeat protein [Spirochaetaceae bacterium]